MKLNYYRAVYISLSISIGLASCPSAVFAITPKDIESKIQEAKILQAGDRVSSAVHQDEVTLHKYKAAASVDTEKDCKIEAVLLARVVFSSDSSFKKVKVRFFERNDPAKYSEVIVQPIHIKSFASGAISQDDLLSSLELTHGVDAAASNSAKSQTSEQLPPVTAGNTGTEKYDDGIQGVSDGPIKEQRAELLVRIRKLHEQNVNTKAFTEQFLQLDKSAKEGNSSATLELFDKLSFNVKEQQKALDRRGQPQAKASGNASSGNAVDSTAATSPEPRGGLGGLSLGELINMDPQKAAFTLFKTKFGVFTPVPGPYQEERNYISSVIIKRQQSGYPVKQFEGMAKGLNDAASVNDLPTLRSRIKNAYAYLQIPSYQQHIMNLQKQGGAWHH